MRPRPFSGSRPCLDVDGSCASRLNYSDHAEEGGSEFPENPGVFLKHHTAIDAPEAAIVRPMALEAFWTKCSNEGGQCDKSA
jgi:2-keto-4-pentenoate hydratase/2-oxohepta-3-ene-1,7-dioic acid hydratase in catechol pathway